MDKYSILLFGRNKVIINDFFMYHDDRLECLSASNRSEDLVNHLKYYTPDALVYCMQEENADDMQQIMVLRATQETNSIPLIIIGQDKECREFAQYSNYAAEYEVRRPMSISQMQERIFSFLIRKRMKNEQEEAAKKQKKHLLVIDDDPLMLKVMKENLRDDYEVATAISGKVAMKYLSSKTVDLIFLDYQMPDESGPEVLEKLQQNEATRDIPVIFLTGVKEREKIQKALTLKPSGYLLKPVERDKLLEVLAKHFSTGDDQ